LIVARYLLRKWIAIPVKMIMSSVPRATPTPIPAFAPLPNPVGEVDGEGAAVAEEGLEEEVLAAAPPSDILKPTEKLSSPVESLISNVNGPCDAAGAYGGVHRYEVPETLANAEH
jgi:hypothetical protein